MQALLRGCGGFRIDGAKRVACHYYGIVITCAHCGAPFCFVSCERGRTGMKVMGNHFWWESGRCRFSKSFYLWYDLGKCYKSWHNTRQHKKNYAMTTHSYQWPSSSRLKLWSIVAKESFGIMDRNPLQHNQSMALPIASKALWSIEAKGRSLLEGEIRWPLGQSCVLSSLQGHLRIL